MKELYNVLGLDETATQKEIKKAYKKLAIKYHPDKFVDCDDEERVMKAVTKFKEIEEAYRVLRDPINRAHYDQTGNTKMPKSGELAVKKVVALFQKYIKEAIEKEMEMDHSGMSDLIHNPMGSVIKYVEDDLKRNLDLLDKLIGILEIGVAKLNKHKRKVINKNNGVNLYLQVIEQQLNKTGATLAEAGIEQIAVVKALEVISEYENEIEPEQMFVGWDPSAGVHVAGVIDPGA